MFQTYKKPVEKLNDEKAVEKLNDEFSSFFLLFGEFSSSIFLLR